MDFSIKCTVCMLLILFSSSFLYSQGSISGIVIDGNSGQSLNGVLVVINSAEDSLLSKKTETDEKGFFSLKDLKPGEYKVRFEYTGYAKKLKDYRIDSIFVKEKSVDTVEMFMGGYETEVIKVETGIPEMTLEDDKKVFNVENLQSTTVGTALDVLKKIPMVEVDMNDNVTLRGTKNLLVLIDNKPMKFSSLNQIPAIAIKKIEIITNPSAKYEAEGVTGIINIVLKKITSKKTGYKVNLFGSIRSNGSYNFYSGTDLRYKKWTFFLNGGAGIFNNKSKYGILTDYFNPVSQFRGNSENEYNSRFYYISAGIEYELSKGFYAGFDSYFNISKSESSGISNNENLTAEKIITSTAVIDNENSGNFNNIFISGYFNGSFDNKGKELNIDFSYISGKNNYENGQIYRYYDTTGVINPRLSNHKSSSDNKNNNLKIQVDYTNPFSSNTKFEAGYKGIFRNTDDDFIFDTLNYNSMNYTRDFNLSNNFIFNEKINALYGTFSHKIKDFRFKAGLRFEHTNTKGELLTNYSVFTKDYMNLFPTLSLTQKIGNENEFQLNYSRRITRPLMYRLNPFTTRSDSRFIHFGNPELSPEFTDSYEFGYNYYGKIGTFNTSMFFRRSYNVISSYSYQYDSVTTATTYRNFAGGKSYGIDLIVSTKIAEWWNVYGNFSFYNTVFEGSSVYEGTEEGTSWKANVRTSFGILDLFDVEVFYNYTGKRVFASGYNEPMQNLDIGIRKSLFKRKLTISLRAEDIFETRKWEGVSKGAGFNTNYSSKWNSRTVSFNISYNFGNTDEYYSKSRKTKKNENEQQDEQEGF